MPTVLGIPVDDALLREWRRWLCPERRPFRVDVLPAAIVAQVPVHPGLASAEIRDAYFLYSGSWTWLDEAEFAALPASVRRALTSAMRRQTFPKPTPPWPSGSVTSVPELATDLLDDAVIAWVEAGVRPSRHREVPQGVWVDALEVLPRAPQLAGTFPSSGSGANCFGTVVAAVGDASADDLWMQLEDMETWIAEETRTVRGTAADDEPGTVLLWREDDRLAHAAVTLGGGYALSKPSQSWSSPRLVWTVRETIGSSRFPGARLSRRRLRRGPASAQGAWSSVSARRP